MPRKRHKPEEIVTKLRQVDVLVSQSQGIADAIRQIGVSEVTYRDELLNGEIFYTLQEVRVIIERWRRHYNTVRPHSSLGYKPPAPEALQWPASQPGPASPAIPVVAPRLIMH